METEINEKIANGLFAKTGHFDDNSIQLASALVEKLLNDGIETVRINFPDQHGILRGKTIAARKLESVLANGLGIPSTLLLKDTAHKTVFDVWGNTHSIDNLSMNGSAIF